MPTADVVQIERGLPDGLRSTGAALYWKGFQQKLGPILGEEDGPALLADTFHTDRVVIARRGDELLGIAGVQYARRAFVGISWSAMRRRYGLLPGACRIALLAILDRENEPGELVMDGIVVDAAARGRGIGTRLLREVLDWAAAEGLDRVRLDVVDTNPDARRLYHRLGFRETKKTRTPWLKRWLGFSASTTMVKRVAGGSA